MSRTKRISAAVVSAAALLFMSTAASALPSVDMIWRNPANPTGANAGTVLSTPTIGASSTVVADIVLRGDGTIATTGVFVTIAFDNTELFAIGGLELTTVNLPGMGNTMAPVGAGVTVNQAAGQITNFDQGTNTAGLVTGSRTLGSVRFHVIAVSGTGEDDVIANLSNTGTDTISTPGGDTTANFGGASLNGPVPEPTTAILVIAGLAGLGYAGRRNLR